MNCKDIDHWEVGFEANLPTINWVWHNIGNKPKSLLKQVQLILTQFSLIREVASHEVNHHVDHAVLHDAVKAWTLLIADYVSHDPQTLTEDSVVLVLVLNEQ